MEGACFATVRTYLLRRRLGDLDLNVGHRHADAALRNALCDDAVIALSCPGYEDEPPQARVVIRKDLI
jgi:hypothetical protein